jgi:hypothetical protein
VLNRQQTAVTGVLADLLLYRISAHSGGTLLTTSVEPMDTNDTLDSNITVRTGATVTEGTNLIARKLFSTDEIGIGASNIEEDQGTFGNFFSLFPMDFKYGKPLTMRSNQGFHVRFATNSTVGSLDFGIVFSTVTA